MEPRTLSGRATTLNNSHNQSYTPRHMEPLRGRAPGAARTRHSEPHSGQQPAQSRAICPGLAVHAAGIVVPVQREERRFPYDLVEDVFKAAKPQAVVVGRSAAGLFRRSGNRPDG
jgi:hypothetical protein